MWKRIIRDYFTFNKRERRGLYVLLIVLAILSITHAAIRLTPMRAEPLSEEDKAQIKKFKEDALALKARYSGSKPADQPSNTPEITVQWSSFDPNIASLHELIGLGLDERIAQRLINYRSKGGKFFIPDDVARIYGMDTLWISQAEPYMKFPQPETYPSEKPWSKARDTSENTPSEPKQTVQVVELNTADSQALVQIPGVGGYTAREIIKMRQGLGGFLSYEQLLDIYAMHDQTFESLLKYTTLDTALMQRININTCDLHRLGRHPYLTWKQARVIINYRQQHGDFQSTRDILKTVVVSDSVYALIKDYLSIQ